MKYNIDYDPIAFDILSPLFFKSMYHPTVKNSRTKLAQIEAYETYLIWLTRNGSKYYRKHRQYNSNNPHDMMIDGYNERIEDWNAQENRSDDRKYNA